MNSAPSPTSPPSIPATPIQARALGVGAGNQWVREGWTILRSQPIAFVTLLMSYMFAILLALMILQLVGELLIPLFPFLTPDRVGTVALLFVGVLFPGLSVGFMDACAQARTGKPIYPHVLVKPFFVSRQVTQTLLGLGLVKAVSLVLLAAIISLADGEMREANNAITNADHPQLEPGAALHIVEVFLFALLTQLPFGVLLWYAPVLAAWRGLSATKAMFFSVVAVWRNLAGFALYLGLWITVWAVVGLLKSGVLVALASEPRIVDVAMIPVMVFIMTWIYCSFYPTYTTVFES